MGPEPNAKPSKPANPTLTALGVNMALVLLLAMIANVAAGPGRGEAGSMLFAALVLLLIGNGVAMLIAFITGNSRWGMSFLFSGLMVLVIGLGVCGYNMGNM